MIGKAKELTHVTLTVYDLENLESSMHLVIDQLMKFYREEPRPKGENTHYKNEVIKEEQIRIFKNALLKAEAGAFLEWQEVKGVK